MTTKTLNQISRPNEVDGLSKLSLKTKATILAVLIGTVPIAIIGIAAYLTASKTIRQQASEVQREQAAEIVDKLNRFTFERYGDIQVIAGLPILSNSKVRAVVSANEKNEVLTRYAATYKIYDNIAAYDLNANLVFSGGKAKAPINIGDRDYFQQALKTGKPFISPPEISKVTGKVSLFFAAPVIDNATGKTIYIAQTSLPIEALDDVIKNFGTSQGSYNIFDQTGKIFLATQKPQIGKNALNDTPNLKQVSDRGEKSSFNTYDLAKGNAEQVGGFAKTQQFEDMPNVNWSNVFLTETKFAFKAESDLAQTIAIGTLIVAGLVAVLAVYIANRATKPIEDAAVAVGKIGKGQLQTRLAVVGQDEIATLGTNINLMAAQLEELQKEQKQEVQRTEVARQEARAEADGRAETQKQEKEQLQARALQLLMEVDPISKGDLTIRAKVTDDEIGTLADSYNSTVLSLRQIVLEVQTTAQQVTDTTSQNAPLVQSLSQEALRQVEEVAIALKRIEEMSRSIRTVADNAQQAENLVQKTSTTLHEGDIAMNRTVDGIMSIRNTVSETSEKLKRLGEASQNVSRVVKLITSFAEQTNLLALNASIEAARAGVQGRGFAVVADEIQSLAQQSAEASAEITDLVTEIQSGTGEVILAMAAGTTQVDIGTKLVEEARRNLTLISDSSQQISSLVEAIALATVEQSKSSDEVSETINDVAAIALKSSTETDRVSTAFKNLLEIAQKLQKSAGRFKV